MSENISPTLPKDAAAAKGMVNVQINGRWFEIPRGARIIEACKMAGVEVPHYCYHPKLSSPGNCRMCLVEQGMPPRPAPGSEPSYDEKGYQPIQWMPRAIIACANTVAENMGIRTEGPLVENARQGVMEFLLANHPLDCPICDQAGECRLQEFAFDYGSGNSKFKESKTKKPKNVVIGPRVVLDDERCIMCSRCIRFMDEVAGDPVLGFTDRGTHTTVMVYPGRELDSNYSLNTVDICPVGALTSRDFRFKMRVWFLKKTPSLDFTSATGTNTLIWSREESIYRITPRRNDEVNSSWMPDSSREEYKHYASEARLSHPLLQQNPASWEQSIAKAAALLQAGEQGWGLVISARQSNEEIYLACKLAELLGISKVYSIARQQQEDGLLISADANPNSLGIKTIIGIEDLQQSGEKLKQDLAKQSISKLLVIGEDLTEAAQLSATQLASLQSIIYLGHSSNPTSRLAQVVLAGSSPFEREGTMLNLSGRLQRFCTAVKAPGEAKSDLEILNLLLSAVDAAWQPCSAATCLASIGDDVESFVDVTLAKVGLSGLQLIQTGLENGLLRNEKARLASGLISPSDYAPIADSNGEKRIGSVVIK